MNLRSLSLKTLRNLGFVNDYDEFDLARVDGLVRSAVAYAEKYQKAEPDSYQKDGITENEERAIIMLATHYYESPDGGAGGLFSTETSGKATWNVVHRLLYFDRRLRI